MKRPHDRELDQLWSGLTKAIAQVKATEESTIKRLEEIREDKDRLLRIRCQIEARMTGG